MTDQKTAKFWDKISVKYAKRAVSNQAAYQKKLDQTRALMSADSRVFEFACGTGTTALYHAGAVQSIDCLDISEKMIEIAQKKAADQAIGNVTFKVGQIEDFEAPFSYDMIMGHSILHLLEDRKTVLEKTYAMLKPGGTFVSSTACLDGIMPWLKIVIPVGHFFGVLPRVYFFTKDALIHEIKSAGFQIETEWQPDPKQGVFIIARKKG